MDNKSKIIWDSGPATGFYIDFENQKVGYADKEKNINHLRITLLYFMASFPGGSITKEDVEIHPELFSINLSNYISDIKNDIRKLWAMTDRADETEELIDQIIEVYGPRGSTKYRLKMECTSILDEITSETAGPSKADDPFEYRPESITNSPQTLLQRLQHYFNLNWLPLFLYAFLILGAFLLLDAFHLSIKTLLIRILDVPLGVTVIFLCVFSALPILFGLLIDVPVALKQFEKKKGIEKSSLDAEKIHKVAMYLVPRFDNSKEHIIFFLICNLTGAFTVASVLLYFKSIPGIKDYYSVSGRDYAFLMIFAAGCLVALLSNFGLQTNNSPARIADNYILSRAHAFMNLLYLSFVMPFAGSLIYLFLSYRFLYDGSKAVITPAYNVMVISAYCYLWFSSDSPAAKKIDSISKNNFITGLPFVLVFTTAYTILCFVPNLICFFSVLTAPAFLLLWLICFLKRKKENTIKLYYFVSSFFSILAITVIVMLALSFRL